MSPASNCWTTSILMSCHVVKSLQLISDEAPISLLVLIFKWVAVTWLKGRESVPVRGWPKSDHDWAVIWKWYSQNFNTLRPRQNGHPFPDDIFKRIFLNKNVWISIKISLKFVPKGPINNIPPLVQMMAWRRPGDKPLSDPMVASVS